MKKLHMILGLMATALVMPTFASQADAPEAGKEMPAPKAEEGKEEAAAEGKSKKHHHKHHKGHKHHHHHHDGKAAGHTSDKFDAPYDEIKKDEDHGRTMPAEVPGQKGPEVAAGQ